MRALRYWLPVLLAAVLQTTFLAAWRPLGVVPALVLVVVVKAAVWGSVSYTLVAAMVGGVALDLAAGDRFGVNTTLLIVVALALAWLRRGGTVFGAGLELAAVALATVLGWVMALVLMLGRAHLAPGPWGGRLVALLLWNLGLALVLYAPLSAWFKPELAEEVHGNARA